MIQTKVMRMLALAGFAPAGKPGYANHSMEALRLVVAVVLMSAAALAQEAPVFSVLYTFTGGTDGSNIPAGEVPFQESEPPLILDSAGNLYGTTVTGGDLSCSFAFSVGCGVVFKLDQTGKETVLYAFTGGTDGVTPDGSLVRDAAGNLYGTTPFGGSSNAGTVFKLGPTGKESVLYTFSGGTDGGTPAAGLLRDAVGNLYGTTDAGGASGDGVVFKLTPTGKETVLYSFAGAPTDGEDPSMLLKSNSGNLYGTTGGGGSGTLGPYGCYGGNGCGTVFKLEPNGKETVLYSFTGGTDGGFPTGWLVEDKEGNLYGTTTSGGTSGVGVVFKVDQAGNETVLYAFTGGTDGGRPEEGLVRDAAGNLYGTAQLGGSDGCGVVFKVDPTGKETVLYAFTGLADGGNPAAGLVASSAGSAAGKRYELYGTTYDGGDLSCAPGGGSGCGVVFKITLP